MEMIIGKKPAGKAGAASKAVLKGVRFFSGITGISKTSFEKRNGD